MEVTNYKPLLKNSLYAEFNLYVPKFDLHFNRIKEFRMEKNGEQRRWFSFPSFVEESLEGKKFIPYVKFGLGSTETAFWEKVRTAVDEFLALHPEMEVQPQSFDTLAQELPF